MTRFAVNCIKNSLIS